MDGTGSSVWRLDTTSCLLANPTPKYIYIRGTCVSLGSYIHTYDRLCLGLAQVLLDVGLRDRSVLFVRAPLDVKPVVERKSKKQREAEEAGEASAYDPERFAGLTPSNVLGKLREEKDAKKKKVTYCLKG